MTQSSRRGSAPADVDDDDQEYFVEIKREEMDSAGLWERVIADLTELEKRSGGKDKSPTAIIKTCLDA